MKIARDTPEQLVIEDVPWGIAIGIVAFILTFAGIGLLTMLAVFFVGLIFFVFGAGAGTFALWAFVRRTQLILDRNSGLVTWRQRTIFDMTEEHHPLAELTGAEVAGMRRRDSEGTLSSTHRVELIFGEVRLPLTDAYSSSRAHLRIARAINDWLDSGRDAA
ncbi:hypothetical protein DRV85_05550 [Rhodosalinus halophilus]|uniref:Uncharacterized protein n=1 Tax=Rhodosalinus halophilus TaxID=2259333 RepID=A0A365UAI4_9RHOB|nr:hypothetical protein [Rhodosalinus halophilus]RBI86220.1 hypothetical protein DRV85_05550 [Rhodosalinus halophilus]